MLMYKNSRYSSLHGDYLQNVNDKKNVQWPCHKERKKKREREQCSQIDFFFFSNLGANLIFYIYILRTLDRVIGRF